MGKEIITFGDLAIEKYKFHHYKVSVFLEDEDIDNISDLTRFLLEKKAINTLLVTYAVTIKLSYYT